MKLEIPKFRYLAQDEDGYVISHLKKPDMDKRNWQSWIDAKLTAKGKPNPNWRDTLIDLEVDNYTFEDGILNRVEK